jgi:hypothetical protein
VLVTRGPRDREATGKSTAVGRDLVPQVLQFKKLNTSALQGLPDALPLGGARDNKCPLPLLCRLNPRLEIGAFTRVRLRRQFYPPTFRIALGQRGPRSVLGGLNPRLKVRADAGTLFRVQPFALAFCVAISRHTTLPLFRRLNTRFKFRARNGVRLLCQFHTRTFCIALDQCRSRSVLGGLNPRLKVRDGAKVLFRSPTFAPAARIAISHVASGPFLSRLNLHLQLSAFSDVLGGLLLNLMFKAPILGQVPSHQERHHATVRSTIERHPVGDHIA